MANKKTGIVYLVGGGPGHPDLITVRGRKILESSDVVIYDYLVHAALLDIAAHAQEKIYIGRKGLASKRPNQAAINQLMIRLARTGKTVVRLKGGDPFIFGRGGEEALALKKANIRYEIVPGVTAAFGAAAYAGIPLTHRELSSDITFVTAHEDPAKQSSYLNWETIAKLKGTLIIYMGTRALGKIAKLLIHFGKEKSTPVAVIRWATTGNQQTVTGTLATIEQEVKRAKITAPTVILVGKVVSLRKSLKWFEEKPLFGKTILVTRARTQASSLSHELQNLGARVVEFPTIEIKEAEDFTKLDLALHHIENYDWLIFTSENGVSAFMRRVCLMNMDARDLHSIQIAAVGSGTEKKLGEYALKADLIPTTFSTEGLFRELKKQGQVAGKRFLLLRTDIAPKKLAQSLVKEGGLVSEISVYRTEKPKFSGEKLVRLLKHEKIDCVTFTSSSTAENFLGALSTSERKQIRAKLVSIGPVTSGTIREFGVKPNAEANPHNIPALVEAVEACFKNGKKH